MSEPKTKTIAYPTPKGTRFFSPEQAALIAKLRSVELPIERADLMLNNKQVRVLEGNGLVTVTWITAENAGERLYNVSYPWRITAVTPLAEELLARWTERFGDPQ